jgi:hypothetical protein
MPQIINTLAELNFLILKDCEEFEEDGLKEEMIANNSETIKELYTYRYNSHTTKYIFDIKIDDEIKREIIQKYKTDFGEYDDNDDDDNDDIIDLYIAMVADEFMNNRYCFD